jgi:hypothetical protein
MFHALVEFSLRYPALSTFEAKRLVQNVTERKLQCSHDQPEQRMLHTTVVPIELYLPDVRDIFLFTVFRTHGVMNMVSHLVKEDIAYLPFTKKSQPEPPALFPAFQDVVNEDLDPGRSALPRRVVQRLWRRAFGSCVFLIS